MAEGSHSKPYTVRIVVQQLGGLTLRIYGETLGGARIIQGVCPQTLDPKPYSNLRVPGRNTHNNSLDTELKTLVMGI